ncbi:hypothetical protein ACFSR7_23670 [Cohnella sp. GCM10020058]|uniref:hypothetical protein n=1 Tax=Cohnella sp. GCM10020058 TaxID=3317330 RepID=UPI00362FF0F6
MSHNQPLQIRYVLDYMTGLYVVSLVNSFAPTQSIVVQPTAMQRYARVTPRAVLGSTSVTYAQASALGFIVTDSANREEVSA